MTNNEIIYSEVNAKYHTPEQRRAILALAYTPEQIAAKGKEIHFQDVPEEQQGEELEKLLLAGLFHTFHDALALHHAGPHIPEQPHRRKQIGRCNLAV